MKPMQASIPPHQPYRPRQTRADTNNQDVPTGTLNSSDHTATVSTHKSKPALVQRKSSQEQFLQTCSNSKLSHPQDKINHQAYETTNCQHQKLYGMDDGHQVVSQTLPIDEIASHLHKDQFRDQIIDPSLKKINSLQLALNHDQQLTPVRHDQQILELSLAKTEKNIPSNDYNPPELSQIIDSLQTVKNLAATVHDPQYQLPSVLKSSSQEEFSYSCTEQIHSKQHLSAIDNKSSCSSEHRDQHGQIWNQDEYELEDGLIDNLNERQATKSQNDSYQESASDTHLRDLELANQQLATKNVELQHQNNILKQALQATKHRKKLLQELNQQYQTLSAMNSQKYQQLLVQNKQLNDLIQEYKLQQYQQSLILSSAQTTISDQQCQLIQRQSKIQQQYSHIEQLSQQLQEMGRESEQLQRINEELENIIKNINQQHEEEIREFDREISTLKEYQTFYREKIEQEGVNINLEDMQQLQQYLQQQQLTQQHQLSHIDTQYRRTLHTLQHQNHLYAQQLQQNSQIPQQQLQQLYSYTQSIIQQYDLELQQRDQEIMALKQQIKQEQQLFSEVDMQHCQHYLQRVDKLTSQLLCQDIDKYQQPEITAEFVYITSKLAKMYRAAERKCIALQEQRLKQNQLHNQQLLLKQQEMAILSLQVGNLTSQKQLLQMNNQQLIEHCRDLRQTAKHQAKQQLSVKQQPQLHPQKEVKAKQVSVIKPNTQIKEERNSQDSNQHQQTMQKLISHSILTQPEKIELALQLIALAQSQLATQFKPNSLQPTQIIVTHQDQHYSLQLDNNHTQPESEQSLLYAAPQVLLGFSESEQSYAWTVGLIIDQLFHSSLFYNKINQIASRSENYQCRDPNLPLRHLLESLLKKKQKQRCRLSQAKAQLQSLL